MMTAIDRHLKPGQAHCMFPHVAGYVKGNKSELSYLLIEPSEQYLTPLIDPRTGDWKLHILRALDQNRRCLATCRRRPHEALLPYTGDDKATHLHLKKVVDRALEINDKMVNYIETNKPTLKQNSARARYVVVDLVRSKLAAASSSTKDQLKNKLVKDVYSYSTRTKSELDRLPFTVKTYQYDEFSGHQLFHEAIKESHSAFEKVDSNKVDVMAKLESQADEALDTIKGCLSLTGDYIRLFVDKTGLVKPDSELQKNWNKLLVARADPSKNNVQDDQEILLENIAKDRVVSSFLVELFEIMSCHAFSFFNVVLGKSQDKVHGFVEKFVDDWIRYCLAPLFWFDSARWITVDGFISANAFAAKTSAPQLLAKKVSMDYEAFETAFVAASTALFATKPLELTPALQEALYERVGQQFNNSFPCTIERKDVFDLHRSDLLQTFEGVNVKNGVEEGRKNFSDLLATLPHLQAGNPFQNTLRMPPFEPNAQFNYFLKELHRPLQVTLNTGTSGAPNPNHTTSYVEVYGHLLLYASKRSNSLFAGKYLIGESPAYAKLEAARKFFASRHVFWVKAETEVELPIHPDAADTTATAATNARHALSKSLGTVDTELKFAHYDVLKHGHQTSAAEDLFIYGVLRKIELDESFSYKPRPVSAPAEKKPAPKTPRSKNDDTKKPAEKPGKAKSDRPKDSKKDTKKKGKK